MKFMKRFITTFIAMTVLLNCFVLGIITSSAHNAMLEVSYDDCVGFDGYGDDEAWYVVDYDNWCYHISHEEKTIKYYFEPVSENGNYTWTTNVSESVANEIKTAYANSMKKWNNVYFYSYDATGNVVKNKIINVVEGTAEDHNLSIYPNGGTEYIATTGAVTGTHDNVETGDILHRHYSKWKMNVYVYHFFVHENDERYDLDYVNLVRERNGAHELGHVLGIFDVDNYCNSTNLTDWHHEEILMGYGDMSRRSVDITYKDIAGVAITRGFHTDADHMWLNAGVQSDGTYKLICSICNGIKYVNSLSGLSYNTYGACNDNHELSDGNMMAVASYGDEDYFKCKYCRYVAPFFSNMPQMYTVEPYFDGVHHKYTNDEYIGLDYSFLEEHTWVNGVCSVCDYEHPHTYISGVCTGCGYAHPHTYTYRYKTGSTHVKSCSCGVTSTEPHFINSSQIVDGRYATCLGCKRMLDLNVDNATILPTSITKISINGSYILPSGIVVLVDEDIEAYMNGTLVFYNKDDLPTVE